MPPIDREFLARLFRFGVSGGVATAVHMAVALSWLAFASPSSAIANAVAFVVANVVSYLMHTLWTFSGQLGDGRTLARFLLVSLLGVCLSAAIGGVTDKLGLAPLLGVLLVVCIVPVVTYVLHRRFTYVYKTADNLAE